MTLPKKCSWLWLLHVATARWTFMCMEHVRAYIYHICNYIHKSCIYVQDLWGPAGWHITNAVIFDVYMSAIVCHLRLFLPWQNHRYGFKLFASTKCIRMSHPLILVIPSPCVPDLRCRVCVIATTPWIYIYMIIYGTIPSRKLMHKSL